MFSAVLNTIRFMVSFDDWSDRRRRKRMMIMMIIIIIIIIIICVVPRYCQANNMDSSTLLPSQ